MVFKGLELRPGERVLWTGAARDARLVDAPNYRGLVRGAILVVVGAGHAVLVRMTIGAPLVCAVGVGVVIYQLVLAARQFGRLRRGRYALTDQRVVVVYDRRTPELVQSELALLGPPLVHVDPDGVGTIAFDRTPILRNGRWDRGGGGPRLAGAPYLYRVAEPERAADSILAAQEMVAA
ncbi:hypothetical protein [Virgisporangium aurantiacum]|uniref:Uncharacterized protein n=1 Tax=Virgisporangium aurantiacum TaxID=175570 RepID=A0A8J4DYH9_9ACTN|nr:hypothetical protein [Virgisporangium aurantiacum]GIJ54463.1 hypothetical protein Vau01_019790 [Virgisporangium aurantiacum]